MRWFFRKLKALSDTHFALWVEYRAELYLWALAGVLPLILAGVWGEVSESGSFDLGRNEFIRYFLAVFVVRQLTYVWVIWEFEELVVTGKLSQLLLQPINPMWRFLVAHVTERIARLPFALMIIGLCFLLFPEAAWIPSLGDCLSAGGMLALSFSVRFLLQYAFSMLAFWSERASSLEELWFLAYMFLSGLIAPLDVYPAGVRSFAELTPFPYLIYYPAQLLIGKGVPLVRGALVLFAWGVGAYLLYRYLWKKGLRQYSAMGA